MTMASRMTLGTVQLGMAYGIKGLSEAPSQERCDAILLAAWNAGVRSIDTARSYGSSEDKIGDFLRRHPECEFSLVTKLDSKVEAANPAKVRDSVAASFDKLGRPLDVVMLHNPSNMDDWDDGLHESLLSCRDADRVRFFGVSVYTPEQLERALAIDDISLIQIPMNAFDQRLLSTDLLTKARDLGKRIHVRSVFLQGLLLMEPIEVEQKFESAVGWIETWRALCRRFERTPGEMATAFVLTYAPEANLIFGCDTPEQVRVNAQLCESRPLDREECEALRKFVNVPATIYDPRKWAATK